LVILLSWHPDAIHLPSLGAGLPGLFVIVDFAKSPPSPRMSPDRLNVSRMLSARPERGTFGLSQIKVGKIRWRSREGEVSSDRDRMPSEEHHFVGYHVASEDEQR
jgi:hypothetical protein